MDLLDTHRLKRGVARGIGYVRHPDRDAASKLILLHGVGSNAGSFAPLLGALPATVDAIAWDAPGYGPSTSLDVAAPSPRDYAEVLAKFLDALDVASAAVVGHSLGALFAASFAKHYPDRVSALALISPALGYGVAPGSPLPEGVQSRIDEILELGPTRFAKKRAARLVGNPQERPDIVNAVEQAMGSVNPAGYIQAVRALGAGQLLLDAATIAAPSIVAVGTLDVITPPKNARSAHAALTNAIGYHEVPDAGHAMPQEQPAALAEILTQTIASVGDV